jgi:uncharacterized protein YcnI
MSRYRFTRRATAGLIGAAAITVAAAAPALAHVTISPDSAAKGTFTVLTLQVPDESDTASTVTVRITLPADHPIADVRTTPMPGWTSEAVKEKLPAPITTDDATVDQAVRTVTWTAAPGTKIGPGQFGMFQFSAGPLPDDTDSLAIPAVQTYDDGTVVNWTDPTPPGGAEPEHPAPTVRLTAAGGTAAVPPAGGAPMITAAPAPAAGAPATSASAGSDGPARDLSIAALLVGALALGLVIGVIIRNRRPTPAIPAPAGGAENPRA